MRQMPDRSLAALVLTAAALTIVCGCTRPATPSAGLVAVDVVRHAGHSYKVATVDLDGADVGLCWKRADGSRHGSLGQLAADLSAAGEDVRFATNAGMFDPGHTPCGLHVEGGRELVPLNLGDGAGNFYLKPNGVFFLTDDGAAVVEAGAYARAKETNGPIRLATQSGPLLVHGGRVHPAFDPASANRAVRSAVGVAAPRRVVFVLSADPVTFHELATLFRDRLGCADALYLDGTISRFHKPAAGAADGGGDFAGMLAVTRRKAP